MAKIMKYSITAGGMLIVCFSLFSCVSYRFVDFDVLEAPEIPVNRGHRIALFDRNVIYPADTTCLLYRYPLLKHDSRIELFSMGVHDAFKDKALFDTVIRITNKTPLYIHQSLEYPVPLSPQEVNLLCEKYGMEYIIGIEYSRFRTNQSNREITDMLGLKLYQYNAAGPIDTLVFEQELTGMLNDEFDFVGYLSDNMAYRGLKYANYMSPTWTRTLRRVYNGGRVLRMADYFLSKDQPDMALQLLESATKSSSRMALKAYLNMAWIYEDAGDFQYAAELLQKARKIAEDAKMLNSQTHYLLEYQKSINKRIQDIPVLEKLVEKN